MLYTINMTASSSLKSTGVCKFLIYLYWISLGLIVSFSLFSLIELLLPSVFQNIDLINSLFISSRRIVRLITFVIFMIWIYRIHVDVKNFFTDYPITPGGALARFIIPFYNIWGIWNTLFTFAERFSRESKDIKKLSDYLKTLIPFIYGFTFFANALSRFLQAVEQMNSIFFLVICLLDISLNIAFLELVKTMGKTITQQAKRKIA